MTEQVRFAIGPVPSHVARAWIANAREIVDAVRENHARLPIPADSEVLEFCLAILDVWEAVACRDDVFQWEMDTTAGPLLLAARQWLAIGSLADHELEAIGCQWAPAWTKPFADALVDGVRAAAAQVPAGADDILIDLTINDVSV